MQKGKWGQHGEQAGGGEEAGLRSYLDSWLSLELFRAGASKPPALSAFGPASGTHTERACIIQVASPAPGRSSELCNACPSLPESPLLRIINKQDGGLYSHFTAGEIHSRNRKSCTYYGKILLEEAA